MQGAALKLTALAASLAVGFVVLMQAQQGLDGSREREDVASSDADLTDQNLDQVPGQSPFEPGNATDDGPPQNHWGDPFAPTTGSPSYAQGQENPNPQAYTRNPQPSGNAPSGPPQSADPWDPFASAPAPGRSHQSEPGEPALARVEAPSTSPAQPSEPDDPFDVFSRQLGNQVREQVNQRTDNARAELQAAGARIENEIQQAVGHTHSQLDERKDQLDAGMQQIQQVAHEATETVENAAGRVQEFTQNGMLQAPAVFPGGEPNREFPAMPVQPTEPDANADRADSANEPPAQANPFQLTGGEVEANPAPSQPRDTQQPMKLELAQSNQRKPSGFNPFTGEEGTPEPRPTAEVDSNNPFLGGGQADQNKKPQTPAASGSGKFNPFDTADTPQTEPGVEPAADKQPSPKDKEASADVKSPAAPPRSFAPPGFPQFSQDDQPAERISGFLDSSRPRETQAGFPAPDSPTVDSAQPKLAPKEAETVSAEMKKPGAFFDEEESSREKSEDGPYRVVPQFNAPPVQAERGPREPAPFRFDDDDETPLKNPASEKNSKPQPLPNINPFGAGPSVEPGAQATESAGPGFMPGPAPVEEFTPEPQPLPQAEENPFGTPPAGLPAPSEAQPPVGNPFGGNPFGAIEKPTPAEFPEPAGPIATESPAPMKPEPEMLSRESDRGSDDSEKSSKRNSSAPLSDEDLIGSARVSPAQLESVQQPKIDLFKSAPENAVLGQPLVYSIEVVNSGKVAVKDVVVEDQFPAGTKLTGTIPRAELVDKTLLWRFDELKPDERKKILVRVIPIESGQVGSISTVSYKSMVATQTLVTAPKLELTVLADEEFAVGESIPLKFVLTNSGQGEAREVILRNLIPVGLEHPAGADLEYEIGDLKGGETKEVTLVLTARQEGRYKNQASVRAVGGLNISNETEVQVIPSILGLSRSGPSRRFVGHAGSFEVTLANYSQRTVKEVRVVEQIPDGFEFKSATKQGVYNSTQRTVTWMLPQLKGGEELTLGITLIPRQTGTMELTVRAEERNGHQAEVAHAVKVEGFASLAVRVPDERGPVEKGERVSLRFRVVNRGSAAARDVNVDCKVPDQLTYISADGPVKAEQAGQVVRFQPVESLGPNQELIFDMVFSADAIGDARVEFEVHAESLSKPLKHQEQVIVYGE